MCPLFGVSFIGGSTIQCSGEVRLVDSNTDGSGRVAVCLNREGMIVGDDSWGVEEATVICRQLGLPTLWLVVISCHLGLTAAWELLALL